MPYFLDYSNVVRITLQGERSPKDARPINAERAESMRLRHGQKLDEETVALLEAEFHLRDEALHPNSVIVSTTPFIYGREILSVLGVVVGNSVRSRNLVGQSLTELRSMVGGEQTGLLMQLNETRHQASQQMIKNAFEMGADAIVGVAFATTDLVGNAQEVIAYGTAVRLLPGNGET